MTWVVALALILSAVALAQPGADLLPSPVDWPQPAPSPETPGPDFTPPVDEATAPAQGAPAICEHSADAAPGQSAFFCGHRFGDRLTVWGRSSSPPGGGRVAAAYLLRDEDYATLRIGERAFDGPLLVWLGNDEGWSRPARLNVPDPWWCHPNAVPAGKSIRIFGRDLSRRPDRSTAHVYLLGNGRPGQWLEIETHRKYHVAARIPDDTPPGDYQLWIHAGMGGKYAWGKPLDLEILPPTASKAATAMAGRKTRTLKPEEASDDPATIQRVLDQLHDSGGGTLALTDGQYPFRGTLRIPEGVTLTGVGAGRTHLQLIDSDIVDFARVGSGGWNQAPGRVHTRGDEIEYQIKIPKAGKWVVWLRYATEMSPWNQPGVSGNMTLKVGEKDPVPLDNLPNTGSFGTYKWSRAATVELNQGKQQLIWRNVKGGGIGIDAYVLAQDPEYVPADAPWPISSDRVVVIQAENCAEMRTRDGTLPGFTRTAVWLSGDRASLQNVNISGSPQVTTGILIRHHEDLRWVHGCHLENCRIADVEGKSGRSAGVRCERVAEAIVANNEIHGRAPIFLQGIRASEISGNRLIPHSRFGNNALAAIVGRSDTIETCVVEGNRVASPPDAAAGGPQVMRMIWVSTGHGSVTHNWFADNGVTDSHRAGAMRFGGVAGHNQNVGEVILFEANHRTMFFGALEGADRQSVVLPATVPKTPEERLGSVKRSQLAYNEKGDETPFWPPDEDDGTTEPPIHEYMVSIMKGPGHGQTRRVLHRDGTRLFLARPWRVTPTPDSVVVIGTGYYRNLIVGNEVPDGMSGIQLWISCVENIAATNTIERMRRPAFFLYANGTTLASSMPRTWNRGISPLFFNLIESNRSDTCSAGALVTSGDYGDIPVEFPRALGNTIRHNSFVNSRTQGVIIRSRKGKRITEDPAPSILGTIVEYNVVRDAPVAFQASYGSAHTVFHRNHAYFWHPERVPAEPPAAFQIDVDETDTLLEGNIVEGRVGEMNPSYVERLRIPESEDDTKP